MKTHLLVIAMSIYSSMNAFAQNRIHGWEIEKITAVQIEFTSPSDETVIHNFNSTAAIETVISFLKQVDFRSLDGTRINNDEEMKYWRCKMIFQGQRDEVYLNQHSASIGKTSFLIDDTVIDDFRDIIRDLSTNTQ